MIISLTDYRPGARFDGEPWTTARIEQADAYDSETWTTIATETLDPVDADPEHPQYRDFSAEYDDANGTWFRVVFVDADGDEQATTAIDATAPGFRPTVEDVAALERVRTVGEDGSLIGTFTAETRPSGDQVERLITQAVTEVDSRVGGRLPQAKAAQGRHAVALYTALLVELSYFPEQVDADSAHYDRLKDLFDEAMMALLGGLPDTAATRTGIYSIPMRADGYGRVGDSYELLP